MINMIKHVHESVTKIKLLSIAHVSFVFYNDLIHQPHVKNTKEQNSHLQIRLSQTVFSVSI